MLAFTAIFTPGFVTYFSLRTEGYSFPLQYLSFRTIIDVILFIVTKLFRTKRLYRPFLVLFLCLSSAGHYSLHLFRHFLYILKTEIPRIAYYLCRRFP